MTEDEAKTKWCPLTYAVAPVYSEDGRGIQEGGPWHCCGSQCMSWRWVFTNEDGSHDDKGYCGLAGRP